MAAGLGSNGAPLTAMAVLEPQFTASGALEVVLATEDGNVLGEGGGERATFRAKNQAWSGCGVPCGMRDRTLIRFLCESIICHDVSCIM